MNDRPDRYSNRGVWVVLAMFALGLAFFFGLKIGAKKIGHYPTTLPTTMPIDH